MMPYPCSTTREEKLHFVYRAKDKLLALHGDGILAVGIYGSLGRGSDGPYSDIEIHVVTRDGYSLQGHEFIWLPFKLEISAVTETEFRNKAAGCDDGWPIRAGSYVDILPIHDPDSLFDEIKKVPSSIPDETVRETMRQFMIWEPYETMAKIRNSHCSGNWNYLPTGATDLAWQTAKLVGLANRRYFSTRARTLEEATGMPLKPAGFTELAASVMAGDLTDKNRVYRLCEKLWTGLNEWFRELGIEYRSKEWPF
ncbi:KNTase domain-containing protein [Cohnella sp. CFH 77786]|nr:KNTase domain-containing protein [Cohnella sp. CFH 77786]